MIAPKIPYPISNAIAKVLLVVWFATVLACVQCADDQQVLGQEAQVTQETQQADEVELVRFDPNDPDAVQDLVGPFRDKSQKWKEDVDKLAEGNSKDGSRDHVLFLGSSSFRLWESIQQDLGSVKVVRRAYGGARYRDLAIHTPKLIEGLKYSKAVVFIANDITGKPEEDVEPETVSKLARLVIHQLRREEPDCQIHLLAVTPTPLRYKYWQRIQLTNAMLRKIAESTPGVFYIPTAYAFLDRDGQPRAELFKSDRLHLNASGYEIWSKIILGALETADQLSR